MFDVSLQQLLLRLVAIVLVSGIAGFAFALFARFFGDRGPMHDERLTINPFTHLDLLAIPAAIFSQTGWIRSIAIDPQHVRGRVAGVLAIVLLGLVTPVLLGWIFWTFRSLFISIIPDATFSAGFMVALRICVEMALGFAVLNLIPLPPLAMGMVLAAIAPALHAPLARHELWLRVALVVILLSGVLQGPLRAVLRPLRSYIGL